MQPVEIPIDVTPGMLIGAVGSDGTKHVSPEAQDILERLKSHYQGLGKPSAAHNYHRHLKSFFSWAEAQGYTIKTLPVSAVEDFLSALAAAGQKESTLYVMRTQLRSALRECNNTLGVDFAHLEAQSGAKPKHLKKADKEREKAKRAEVRAEKAIATAAAIRAAHQVGGYSVPQPRDYAAAVTEAAAIAAAESIQSHMTAPEESPVSTESVPTSAGAASAGGQSQQPIHVHVNAPTATGRPTPTIGAPARPVAPVVPKMSVTINQFSFTGPHIRITRLADGTDPLTPPGSEVAVTTIPLTQIAPHGDVSGFMQQFIIPNIRGLSPLASQVHFVFHELNDRRQPTGRRDELIVGLPMTFSQQGAMPQPQSPSFGALPTGYGAPAAAPANDATSFLLKKLDEEAADAKAKADALQQELRKASDAQTVFMLNQQFQQMQDLKRELEERKAIEMQRMMSPPPMPMPLPTPISVEPIRPDTSLADAMRAMAEQQAKTLEVLATVMRPAPAAPVKDTAEWLVPFMGQMQQQAQAQAAAQQQMMLTIMQGQAAQQQAAAEAQRQASQQMMQLMMGKESTVEKILIAQLQEAKAAANAPKGDDVEDFAEKLQKMKMVAEMMGGNSGGGGGGGLISELLSNAEQIGAGAAQIISAAKERAAGNAVKAPDVNVGGNVTAPAGELPPASAPQEAPRMPEMPREVSQHLDAIIDAATAENAEGIINGVLGYIKSMTEAPEPWPKLAQRMLNGFADADDEGELYTFAKSMWMLASRTHNRALSKLIAAIIAENYSQMHEAMFGTPRALPGAQEETEETVEETQQEAQS